MDHQSHENDVTPPRAELPMAVDVIRRMKEVAGLKADMHLASTLGTTRANIAKWKSRNSIPYEEAIIICNKYGSSLDYVLLGIHPVPYLRDRLSFQTETQLIRKILQKYVNEEVIVQEPGSPLDLDTEVQIMANILTSEHSKLLIIASRIEKVAKVGRREAIRLAMSEMGYGEDTPAGPQ